ncbi:hypothetical protein CIB84_008614 [Bambusicola thoracicus]|uniref:Uncharacterized protein n=1 Tax=Bambusicola thoracicus TaxID=9083 RepID=A0A2P4SU35_BAMTH|nr:hypothetical protein CIB84_008614 [Bambusicola thoracicus]
MLQLENNSKTTLKCYRPAQRKGEPVNFSKLISNGYGTDWLQQHSGYGKKIQDKSKDSEQPQVKQTVKQLLLVVNSPCPLPCLKTSLQLPSIHVFMK